MIFVTVGTHEQQFNRLVESIDKLKRNKVIEDEVIIQTGYSTYIPEHCKWSEFYTYEEMAAYVEKADIVITHGGPSSFMMPLQIGKIPLVVPRRVCYNEHVNDHQLEFARAVADRQGNIIVVEHVEELGTYIEKYSEIIGTKQNRLVSNNDIFNKKFKAVVDELFG